MYYMDSAKTVKATIRIPEELALRIDKKIMPNGPYTSMPDFIASATRQYAFRVSEVIFKIWDNFQKFEQDSIRLYHFEEYMNNLLIESQEFYAEYNGKPVTVIIRISPNLVDFVNHIIDYGPKHDTLQDFVRAAVARQIDDDYVTQVSLYYTTGDIRRAKRRADLEKKDDGVIVDFLKKDDPLIDLKESYNK